MSRPEDFVTAGTPAPGTEIPAAVLELAGSRTIRPVWRNELGGVTFALGDDRFVKWQPPHVTTDLGDEVWRLLWARRYTAVPRVLDDGGDEDGRWILTQALPGGNAAEARWRDDPLPAVRAIGTGLRALHDRLPVDDCPFEWSLEQRRAAVRGGARRDPATRHPDHRGVDWDEALRILDDAPDTDELVVCHGDACVPNTLLDEGGRVTGHVDLGSLGVADRWADLAVATWSTTWNYGTGWEQHLLDAYGIDPDPARTSYYRLLWDLSP